MLISNPHSPCQAAAGVSRPDGRGEAPEAEGGRGRVALKICVVGGGSTYTPELVDGIARRSTRLEVDQLDLFDISAERREIVGDLARRMLRHNGWDGQLNVTGDRAS